MYQQLVSTGYLVTAVLLAVLTLCACLIQNLSVKKWTILCVFGLLIATVIATLILSILWQREI